MAAVQPIPEDYPQVTVPDCISVCQSALTGGTERSCVTWSPKAPCSGSRV
jgi:hypothetical protein